MANIFIDTNLFFDIVVRNKSRASVLDKNKLYISPLTYHIYCYTEKIIIPDKPLNLTLINFTFVNLTKNILRDAMWGPTKDLEDNIQLHSATKAGCDYFLTNDSKLLKMKRFGKVKISSRPPVAL